MTMLFVNTWKAPFITHMLGSSSKSFFDIIMNAEMIENAIRNEKIDAGESSRRSASKKKENEVSETRQNTEKLQFTPIPMSYRELYQNLFNVHVVSPYQLKPLQPPYPKWYNAITQCDYHARIVGHSIEHCTAFKKLVERLISMSIVKLDDSPNTENSLPNHNKNGVNMIGGNMGRKIKKNIAEVKVSLRWIWKKMVERGLFVLDSVRSFERVENYCEFYHEEGREIEECKEFRALVQGLIDNKEIEFYEEVKEEGRICTSESLKVPRVAQPVVIISRPKNDEARTPVMPRIIIKKPAAFSYQDSRKVPWNYKCNTTVPGKETSNDQDVSVNPEPVKKAVIVEQKGKIVEPVLSINKPVKEEEAVEFLKFLKHSKYNVVKQLHKQSARISVLALLLNLEVHRNALMKMLNETYVANDISVGKLDRLVNNISADNFIFFNDDEIPLGDVGSTKALHITARCKGHIFPRVLIDNGSALNMLPLFTLNRLPIDREENQMADALATLASMSKVDRLEDMKPIQISIYDISAHYYSIEKVENDDCPWYQDILLYVKNHEYPDQATENDKRTLRRMEAVLPIEVEIHSLWVLAELKLEKAEWIQSQYDQLNLIEERRLKAIRHGQMYQKRMMRAYNKKVCPREFHEGDLVLKKILPL
ncbi:uncharacterized protein [Gossypium hirsutum]|uniref:Uncharacterized protein n=1 Tax=Gossypium hirsutum TaxID=3635 RepID=A0ABM3BA70_GOSHI|nr:uncharacterized protein LOC121224550 [Gossypium hirsutum]